LRRGSIGFRIEIEGDDGWRGQDGWGRQSEVRAKTEASKQGLKPGNTADYGLMLMLPVTQPRIDMERILLYLMRVSAHWYHKGFTTLFCVSLLVSRAMVVHLQESGNKNKKSAIKWLFNWTREAQMNGIIGFIRIWWSTSQCADNLFYMEINKFWLKRSHWVVVVEHVHRKV
jgi:hypothetical protein